MARCASLILAASLFAASATAQTWTGAGSDDNWSTGANWSGGVAPASSATTQLTFPVGSPRFSPVVDAPWTVNSLTFMAAYTLSGQPITLAGVNPGIQINFRATIANPIVLTGPTVFSSQMTQDFTGGVSGTGPLSVAAVGGTAMSGTNTYSGGTTIVSGGFALTGSMLGPVTVGGPGTSFVGNGTVNGPVTVNAGATINGTLATGNLAVAGNVLLGINGPVPGQYDSIRVTGTVTLTNATLTLSGSYVPAPDDVFLLIDNDGTDPVAGTFSGLPEGSIIDFNGVPRRLSYFGGTGNDVTLGPLAVGLANKAPTLSEWALLLLSAVMLGIGLHRVRGSSPSARR